MAKTIYRTFSGHCPETGRQMRVNVGFKEIRMAGSATICYKKSSFQCEYLMEHGCSLKDNCPIVKSAEF